MSNTTFPNGESLLSSALTPDGVNVIFQPVIASILSIDPVANPTKAFYTVRVGWQQTGQPAWAITENVCIIRATPVNDPYSRVRDSLYNEGEQNSLTLNMGFTQVWNVHCTLYGPNAYDNARLILSAITFDWVAQALATSNLYLIVKPNRPQYVPELFEGQWWKRADIDIQYNEQASESLTVPAAAFVDISLQLEDGTSETFPVPSSS